MDISDIRGKKVLVTGGAGFIGSHTVDALIARGADVLVLDNFVTGKRDNVNPAARLIETDVNDPGIGAILEAEKPEIVYHFAFNTNVPRAVDDPLYDARSITGSLNLLQHLSKVGSVKKFFFPSSGFVYGNSAPKPTDESSPIEAISPYVVSKSAVEKYIEYFHRTYGLPYVIYRYGAIYGPRQTETGAMRAYIKDLSEGRQSEMYGEGTKTRDYVYIEDIVRVNLLALAVSDSHPNQIFNVGTSVETSLLDLYEKIAALLGKEAKPVMMPERLGEQLRYSLDSSKIKKELGWEPVVSLDEGLKKTLQYWKLI